MLQIDKPTNRRKIVIGNRIDQGENDKRRISTNSEVPKGPSNGRSEIGILQEKRPETNDRQGNKARHPSKGNRPVQKELRRVKMVIPFKVLSFNSSEDFLKSPEFQNEILPALILKQKAERETKVVPTRLQKVKGLFKKTKSTLIVHEYKTQMDFLKSPEAKAALEAYKRDPKNLHFGELPQPKPTLLQRIKGLFKWWKK
jgi:hypothetical protein